LRSVPAKKLCDAQSYLSKGGSAVRIDWKKKYPKKCLVFFECQTRLVEISKEIYGDTFEYVGKRALVLQLSQNFLFWN
jgi:hypothetical protein